jgi:predicted ribosomally synthesized peptide with nif11-like leader
VSIESLRKFYERIRSDPELAARATSALEDGPEALIVLGLLKGFEFTEEELLFAMSRRSILADGELSDEDLDFVAGGGRNSCEHFADKQHSEARPSSSN